MYFQGNEAEQFAFLRIPRLLMKDKRYKTMSVGVKMLYGLGRFWGNEGHEKEAGFEPVGDWSANRKTG